MRISSSILTLIAAGIAIAGCSTGPTLPTVQSKIESAPASNPEPVKPAQPADKVAGKWQPTDPKTRSVYYNEFKNKRFAAYTVDGKNTLALGSYTPSENGASFEYFSQTKKRQIKGNCQLSSSSSMTCRTDDGSSFDLQRS